MTIIDLPIHQMPGLLPAAINSAFGYTSQTLDGAGKKYAIIMQAPKTGTIAKVGFRAGTVSSGGNVDVRIETVDPATGDPTGTLFGTDTNATQAIAAANTWYSPTLTAGASVTKGQLIAVVVVNSSGSYIISGISAVYTQENFPSGSFYNASWAKVTNHPAIGLEYDDGSYAYAPAQWTLSGISTTTFNSGSTPNERGVRFTLPAKYRAIGAYCFLDFDGDTDLILYDSDGTTPLRSVSLDKDIRASANTSLALVLFSSGVELAADTVFRLAAKPTSVTNIVLAEASLPSVAAMATLPGGAVWHKTTRSGGGWTEDAQSIYMMGLIVDGIEAGGGGGRLVDGGLAG